MKQITKIMIVSVGMLLGLMAIHGNEGYIRAHPENLFTSGGGHRIEYATWCRPQLTGQFFEGNRWHFGFPCWALYLDVSTQSDAWYAKLDLPRFVANWLCATILAVIAALVLRQFKPNHDGGEERR